MTIPPVINNPLAPIYQSELFFGRNAYKNMLMELIRKNKVSILFGESGVGKTSLLYAGLVPYLHNISMFPVFIQFWNEEYRTVEEVFFEYIHLTCREYDIEISNNNSDEISLAHFLEDSEFVDSKTKSKLRPLIILDQFERYSQFSDCFKKMLFDVIDTISFVSAELLICIDSAYIHCLHRLINNPVKPGLLCLPPFSIGEIDEVSENLFPHKKDKKEKILHQLSGYLNPTQYMLYMNYPKEKPYNGSIWDVISTYYQEVISILSTNKKRLFEEYFLLRDGSSIPVSYDDLRQGIGVDCIQKLINRGIILVYNFEGITYCRITNNLLTKVIHGSRINRNSQKMFPSLYNILRR